MQSRCSGERKSYKRFKYTIQEVNCSTDAIDESSNRDAATNTLAEAVNNASSTGSAVDSCSVERPLTSSSPTVETPVEEIAAISANDHTNAESAL
jgi:hypothetical protein